MVIGVPKEIKDQEFRVALLPSAAYQLIKRGHRVIVQSNAGAGSGYPDNDYVQAGAEVVPSHEKVFADADLIVKVKEPQASEIPLLRKGQILFTYLHLAPNKALTEALMKSRRVTVCGDGGVFIVKEDQRIGRRWNANGRSLCLRQKDSPDRRSRHREALNRWIPVRSVSSGRHFSSV